MDSPTPISMLGRFLRETWESSVETVGNAPHNLQLRGATYASGRACAMGRPRRAAGMAKGRIAAINRVMASDRPDSGDRSMPNPPAGGSTRARYDEAGAGFLQGQSLE